MCCKDHQEHLADEDRLAYNDGCSFASVKDRKSVCVRAYIFRVSHYSILLGPNQIRPAVYVVWPTGLCGLAQS